jgi:hypothetical protein
MNDRQKTEDKNLEFGSIVTQKCILSKSIGIEEAVT